MTKRKENEPDNKAFKRLRDFERQRDPVPGDLNQESDADEKMQEDPETNYPAKKETEKHNDNKNSTKK